MKLESPPDQAGSWEVSAGIWFLLKIEWKSQERFEHSSGRLDHGPGEAAWLPVKEAADGIKMVSGDQLGSCCEACGTEAPNSGQG